MAEEAPTRRKRQLRPATSETVRERAERVQKGAEKPKRALKARNAVAKPLSPLAKPFRPIGRLFKRIGATKFGQVAGKILVPTYFRGAWGELRQVTWPNFRQSIRLTSAVLIFSIVFGVLIAVTDYGLDKLFKKVILKQ